MALIYPITAEESQQLLAVNEQTAMFVPCWWPEVNGLAVSEEMLEDPAFARHREIFESWEKRQPVEVSDVREAPF
jgi:hypothetical protein